MNGLQRQSVVAVLAASLLLTACVPAAVVGGTAAAGVVIANDRRSVSRQSADSDLASLVDRRLRENFGDRIYVNANTYDGVLLLTGEVPTTELKAEVDTLIKLTPNVRRTVDEIRIRKLSESRWRGNDTLITSAVIARFGQSGKLDLSVVKVVTESNTVFLMGKVTQKEADTAIDIARNTQGVSSVVNVMNVVPEEEIARLKAGTASAPASSSPATPAAAPRPPQ